MPTTDNGGIQSAIAELGRKIDELISSLPNTYVTIRNHELQIKTHEDKLNDAIHRILMLEQWKHEAVEIKNEEHNDLRQEWKTDLEKASSTLDSVEKNVLKLSEHFSILIKILLWLLGILTTVLTSILIAYLTHFIK